MTFVSTFLRVDSLGEVTSLAGQLLYSDSNLAYLPIK